MVISNRFVRALLLLSLTLTVTPVASKSYAQSPRTGASKHPIIDSRMTAKEAFDGLDPKCPAPIRKRQKVVKLKYYSSDGKIHQGQLVIDGELKNDIRKVFALALKEHFPIYSVIPISDKRFRRDGWDDELSMEANNTSAFNYREITGGGRLSNHHTAERST
jgi:peptidoglycan LD-endopeptidase CwlK